MSMFEARVEAAAKALYEVRPNGDIAWDSAEFDDWMEREDYRVKARAAVVAADAVVTEGRIEEALRHAFEDWNESDSLFAVQARAVMSLLRGGAK